MNASSYKLKKTDSIFLSLQRQLSFVWIFLVTIEHFMAYEEVNETRISYFAFYVS